MFKTILLAMVIYAVMPISADDNRSIKKPTSLGEKALFINKNRYDKALEKKYKRDKKNKTPMKIYKRKDGSIDTLKTINEANN